MAANSILKLRVDSSEYDAKLKKAAEGLQHLAKAAHDSGSELLHLEKDEVAFIREMGSMNTSAKTAAGSIREMESTLKAMTLTYKQMSDAEKSGNAGKALADAMVELRSRLIPAKQALAETEKEMRKLNQEVSASQNPFGKYGNIIDTIGSKFGVSGNLTEMLTSRTAMLTGAVGAGIAIVTKATEAWAGYNKELAKQDQITTITTGLKGDAANQMTNQARALVDTYNVDFRESINAANTLMTQFGESGEQAMQLIKDGMQGMIQGDGPKLLSMIQQYAPAFRDAGVSASQLVAVIQNSEGGIFTDQNMNAIVMGIKNIRLMTKATSDALAQLGIDGKKMSQQLSNGTLTIFDALKQVAAAVQNVNSNSQAAGEVMQQVFGRQGAMAGTNLGKAIATLNTNLEETKKQTGEVGDAFNDLYESNLRLNTAIRDAFGYDGWEQMATGIKTTLIGALSDVIEHLAIIREGFAEIGNFFGGGGNKGQGRNGYKDIEDIQKWINNGKNDDERRRRYEIVLADLQRKLNNVGKEYQRRNADGSTSFVIDDAETQAKKRAAIQKRMEMLYATSYTEPVKPIEPTKPTKPTKGGNNTENIYAPDSIAYQEKLVSDLTKKWKEAGDAVREGYAEQLGYAQQKLEAMKGGFDPTKIQELTDLRGKQLTLTVTADAKDALEKVRAIEGVTIDDKAFTVTVTADDEKAAEKLRNLGAVEIGDKTFSVKANVGDTLEKVRAIEGVTIDDKTFNVTAETAEALRKLREIDGFKISPKTIEVTEESRPDFSSDMKRGKDMKWHDATTPVAPSEIKFSDGLQKWLNYMQKQDSEKKEVNLASEMSKIAGGVSGIFSGIESLGVELPQGLKDVMGGIQGMISILSGIATIVGAIETISTANLFKLFAGGGVVKAAVGYEVPGNHFSGDMVPALLNSGETVLNRAQSGIIASALEGAGGGFKNGQIVGRIEGEKIVLVANHFLKRSGQGELLTWKN